MSPVARRRLLIAAPLVGLVLVAVGVLLLPRGRDLKSRSARITVGMPREEVEDLLGRPVLVIDRSGGRGTALAWTDQLWQVTVYTDPDGRAEIVDCMPSDSFYRRTVGRVVSLPK